MSEQPSLRLSEALSENGARPRSSWTAKAPWATSSRSRGTQCQASSPRA